MIEFNVQIMGETLETKGLSDGIGDIILKLGLKRGDTLRLWPFNTFSREDSTHVGETKLYHGKLLSIYNYEVNICTTWNKEQKAMIYINLVLTDNY